MHSNSFRSQLLSGFIILAVAPLAVFAQAEPATDSVAGRLVFENLGAYYANVTRRPAGFDEAKHNLTSDKPEEASSSVEYLMALIDQMEADQTNGRTTNFRHGVKYLQATRKSITLDFAKRCLPEHSAAAAKWLLTSQDRRHAEAARILIGRLDDSVLASVAADALMQRNCRPDNLELLLRETQRRKLNSLKPHTLKLCNHHRTRVRTAARDAATALGIQTLPEAPAPGERFPRELSKAMYLIAGMISTEIPESAKWVSLRSSVPPKPRMGQDERFFTPPWRSGGWLLSRTAAEVHVLDWFGVERTFPSADVILEEVSLGKHVDRLLKEGSRLQSGSAPGNPAAQPKHLRDFEAVVAAWCFVRGDRERAAAIILPRIDECDTDGELLSVATTRLGWFYHQQMLDAFARDRDYQTALQLATHLSKPAFRDFVYHSRCKALAAQLPNRTDDFTTLKLPTHAEWGELSESMDRKDQIRFLMKRMRLLNSIQRGQPGSVWYSVDQTAVPISSLPPMGTLQLIVARPEAVSVINPYVLLRGMQLNKEELLLLSTWLNDEDYVLCYGFWRDFDPGRQLHRVNWVVAELINKAVGQELVRRDQLESDKDVRKFTSRVSLQR